MDVSPHSSPTFLCPACGNVLPRPNVPCDACAPVAVAPGARPRPAAAVAGGSGAAGPAAVRPAEAKPRAAEPRPGPVTAFALLQGFVAVILGLTSVGFLLASADSGEYGIVALVLGALTALAVACAHGLWTMQPRGRSLQLWLGALGLLCFPVGTVIGALALFYLTRPQVRERFREAPLRDAPGD